MRMRHSLVPCRVTTSMTRVSPRSGRAWRASKVCGIREASGGSLVDWMAARGTTVLAIDIDTRFVEPLAGDAIEVRRVDIRTEELPQRQFDGRRVVADMVAAALTDVHGEGRALISDSRSPGFDFFSLSFESLRDAVVDAGRLSRGEADAAAARFTRDIRVQKPLMMAGIGCC